MQNEQVTKESVRRKSVHFVGIQFSWILHGLFGGDFN